MFIMYVFEMFMLRLRLQIIYFKQVLHTCMGNEPGQWIFLTFVLNVMDIALDADQWGCIIQQ